MQIKDLHPWDIQPHLAIELQQRLAKQIRIKAISGRIRFVAGLDCSFDERRNLIFAAVAVLDIETMKLVEQAYAVSKIQFPYIPGLLSFREAPAMLKACSLLETEPQLVLVDGQGIAHPRRLGIASHIGLCLAKPTIGCAKAILIGNARVPGRQKGCYTTLTDPKTGQVIGAAVRTRTDVRPVYVSPGHRCDLADAIRWTIRCTTCYRIPEPIRLAHQGSGRFKASWAQKGLAGPIYRC